MNVLISGDRGFIGTHLKLILKKKNLNIIVLKKKIKKKNLYELKKKKIDFLIHLAGIAHNKANKQKIFFNNYNVTKILTESVDKKYLKKIVFLSTSKIDQLNKYKKINNENINDYYCLSKIKAENFIKKYCLKHKINYSIIRPTLIYGKGVKGNLKNLAMIIKKGYPLPFKSFKTNKSYLSITNLLNFIKKTLNDKKTNNKTIILSDSNPVRLDKLINKLYSVNNIRDRNFYFPKFMINLILRIIGKKELLLSLNNDFVIDKQYYKNSLKWIPLKFSLKDLRKIYYE